MSSREYERFSQFQRLYWDISRNMSFVWREIYEKEFPGSQSHILFLLERNGSTKMSKLAELLYLTPGAVTTAADKLILNEYIARTRDENDRRVIRLEITDKGKEALRDLQEKGREAMSAVFSHLSDEDLDYFISKLDQASQNIERVRKEIDE